MERQSARLGVLSKMNINDTAQENDAGVDRDAELLRRVRIIADYQFGTGAGSALFPGEVSFIFSRTSRVRQILENGLRIATLRASDGLLTLSIKGARRLHARLPPPAYRVTVRNDVAEFIVTGGNVFAKHVIGVDPDVRARDEVLVVDENDKLLATGSAVLCAVEMHSCRRGVAVDVRSGVGQK